MLFEFCESVFSPLKLKSSMFGDVSSEGWTQQRHQYFPSNSGTQSPTRWQSPAVPTYGNNWSSGMMSYCSRFISASPPLRNRRLSAENKVQLSSLSRSTKHLFTEKRNLEPATGHKPTTTATTVNNNNNNKNNLNLEWTQSASSIESNSPEKSSFCWIEPQTNGSSRISRIETIQRKMNSSNPSKEDTNASTPNSLQLYNSNPKWDHPATMGSPGENRREFGMPRSGNNNASLVNSMPLHSQLQGYALCAPPGTKMLVDPSTGQQYFLPTAQPHVAYYPVLLSNAAPSSQPVYYTAPPPPGYFVAHQQVPSSPSHHSSPHSMFFQRGHPESNHASQYAHASQLHGSPPNVTNYTNVSGSPAYHVEIPPSNASVASSSCFQRHHESRVSIESGRSTASNSSRNKYSDDSMLPCRVVEVDSTRQRSPQKLLSEQPNSSARYGSTTSSTTSGFISGGGEPVGCTDKSRLSARSSLANDLTRAQFQESPNSWWNQTDQQMHFPQRNSYKFIEEADRSGFQKNNPESCECRDSSISPKPFSIRDPPCKPQPLQKAIRMDIDLSQPIESSEVVTEQQHAVAKANVAPPTSFTVSFDDMKSVKEDNVGGSGRKGKTSISLQDAARQAPTGRRLLRRTMLPTTRASPETSEGPVLVTRDNLTQDPKQYLFSKMFQNNYDDSNDQMSSVSMYEDKRECDVISEAGTYVVESKAPAQNMMASQLIDSDDESNISSSTSATISDNAIQKTSANAHQQKQEQTMMNLRAELPAPHITPDEKTGSTTPGLARRSLMSDLRKLREEKSAALNTINSPTGAQPASPRHVAAPSKNMRTTRALFPVASNPPQQMSSTGVSSRLCQNTQQRPQTGTNNFRPSQRCRSESRGDGGRFSMRTSAVHRGSDVVKPPFRTGMGSFVKPSINKVGGQQDSPEMTAWLRRKEYDPRKAAAEARKMQQLKQRLLNLAMGHNQTTNNSDFNADPHKSVAKLTNDDYLANRSISYHNAAGNSAFHQWSKKPLGDERSNKSHDNLSHLGEEIEDFGQLSIAESTGNIKKTVDELTLKCHKSIELIRLCNRNALSPSVENLLQSVVDSTTQGDAFSVIPECETSEHISNRLERLSSAFDAIQKYLEEQSSWPIDPMRGTLNVIRPRADSGSGLSSTQKLFFDITGANNERGNDCPNLTSRSENTVSHNYENEA